ncbi:MAG TPA: ABC transporter permease [Gammaproteobacteria bacterium]|nr:ABC transporter permease [Gammaproteobacteria bacterium]
MPPVAHLVKKETLLLLRDRNALVLLFVMPAIFILIMSLALQNRFAAENGVKLKYYLVNQDAGPVNAQLLDSLRKLEGFSAIRPSSPPATLENHLADGDTRFLLVVPKGFGSALMSAQPESLRISISADVTPQTARLFTASLRATLGRLYLRQLAKRSGRSAASAPDFDLVNRLIDVQSTYTPRGHNQFPSSVQQNVPAWLLFAMFFIAIPLSTTWVQERDQGTYARLRGMGVGAPTMLAGKLFPYVVLNLLQVALMLLVGVYVVPWVGGEQLTTGSAWGALALVSAAASFAAVSYALLVANLVTTGEQATIFTGVANLLMAALGGIMVPRFVMPAAMQAVSHYSPMAWGLDGFLDVFLRGGGVGMVVDSVWRLGIFGALCLLATGAWMTYRRGRAGG